MDVNDRAAFFAFLQEDIQESDLWTNLAPPQDDLGETLRVMMPVTDDEEPCLLEIMTSSFVEEADLLVFYTTVIDEIGPGGEDLSRAILKWNLESPLGEFGIYETPETKQLYHKYTLLFDPEIDPEELVDIAMFHLMLIFEVISQRFKEACALSDGNA